MCKAPTNQFAGIDIYSGIEDPNQIHDTFHINLSGQYDISRVLWNTSALPVSSNPIITRLDRMGEVRVNRSNSMSSNTPSQQAFKGYSEVLRILLTVPGPVGIDYSCEYNVKHELLSTTSAWCLEFDAVFNKSGRVSNPSTCRSGNLVSDLEDLSFNFTLGLLSSPTSSESTIVSVEVFTWATRYSYNWKHLVMADGAGILLALYGVCVGSFPYITDGYSASMSFSSIMFTTRNPDLDRLSEGRCLPAMPLGSELGKTKLRCGLLREEGGGEHDNAAFGLAKTITHVRKGVRCR